MLVQGQRCLRQRCARPWCIYLYKIRLDLKVDDLSYDSLLSVCAVDWGGCNVKFTRCPTTLNRASHLEKKHHGELGGSPPSKFQHIVVVNRDESAAFYSYHIYKLHYHMRCHGSSPKGDRRFTQNIFEWEDSFYSYTVVLSITSQCVYGNYQIIAEFLYDTVLLLTEIHLQNSIFAPS